MKGQERPFYLKCTMIDPAVNFKVERDVTAFSWYHNHEFIEMVYCESGAGKHVISGVEYEMKAGDVFMFNAGVLHKIYSPHGKLNIINIMFPATAISESLNGENFVSDFYEQVYGAQGDKKIEDEFVHVSSVGRGNYGLAFSDILNEYNLRLPRFEKIIKQDVTSLLLKMFRDITESSNSDVVTMEQKKMIEQIMRQIDENICTINKIDDLSDQIGYNKIYFNRLFQKFVGTSISKYLKKRKMHYACNLLSSTNYTIEHICEIIGYNDIKNFYKTFKAVEKITPGAYREKVVHNFKEV